MNRHEIVNSILKRLNDKRQFKLLKGLSYLMYKLKGHDIRAISYDEHSQVWEYKIGKNYFYSTAPGWCYSQSFLEMQFAKNLGRNFKPQPGNVIIDIGAGVGEEIFIFSKMVGDSGKVYAIEANPITFSVLQRNKEKNRLDNVEIFNIAIAEDRQKVFIQNSQNSLANRVVQKETQNTFQVDGLSLDQFVEENLIKKIDYVKVNIEGAERFLIQGMKESTALIDHIAISCHDFLYHSSGDSFYKTKDLVISFLNNAGFNVTTSDFDKTIMDDYVYGRANK